MSKQKIREWLKKNYPDMVRRNENVEFVSGIIHQYTQDQSGWVSVEDRLPDDDEEAYMVTDGKYVNITVFDWEESCFLKIPNCALVNITHWMPLPLPPTKEA